MKYLNSFIYYVDFKYSNFIITFYILNNIKKILEIQAIITICRRENGKWAQTISTIEVCTSKDSRNNKYQYLR